MIPLKCPMELTLTKLMVCACVLLVTAGTFFT